MESGVSSGDPKKKRKDQIPVQVAPETKVLLATLKERLGADMKDIVHAAVVTFSEQPLHWQRRAVGLLSEAEYLAIEGSAAAKGGGRPKGSR